MTRLLLLADVHANLAALDAVLGSLDDSVDLVLSAGDQVGLGPWPGEVLARLDDLSATCVLGNHDAECVSGRSILQNPQAVALAWTREVLPTERLAALSALPERRDGDGWTLVHASLRGPLWEFLIDRPAARASFDLFQERLGVFGHTHLQGGFVVQDGEISPIDPRDGGIPLLPGARYLVNPGSVGAPRDGDPRAGYAIVDLERGWLRFGRVAYPVEEVVRALRRAGLPPALGERLREGR